jgi:hypothetical protein
MNTNDTNTDEQLKQALAKMLPYKINFGYNSRALFWSTGKTVLDTEILHLCWMVEDDFNSKQQDDYGKELYKLIPYGKMLFSATWQQRVTALAKVKGIKI